MNPWATNEKREAGRKARNIGASFEDIFSTRCQINKVLVVRIPDAAKTIRKGKILKVVRAKSPFDFLITKDSRSSCIDTKTVEGKTFSYSSIDQKQVEWLSYTEKSINSGYVIWYRETDEVVFYTAGELKKVKPKTGLKPGDGLCLGKISDFNPATLVSRELFAADPF